MGKRLSPNHHMAPDSCRPKDVVRCRLRASTKMFLVSTPVRSHARVDILGVGVGWGVGRGGMLTFIATATTHYARFLALPQ